MSNLLEVLKDKTSRRQVLLSGAIFLAMFIFIFIVGFFSAFVYNYLFPSEGSHIQDQINKAFGFESRIQREAPRPNV